VAGSNLTFNLFGKDQTASSALKKVGDQSEDTHKKFGAFGKGAKAAAVGMAAGVAAAGVAAVVAGKQLIDMGKAAAEDAAGQQRLALGLKNTTGATTAQVAAVEGWISAQGRALGVTDDQLRPALQRLAQSTKDVGEAQDLSALAMDISAGSGKSLESVATALAKAHDGNAGALARLGVQTKDAEGKTLSFEEIVKNAATTFEGQAAAGADTLAGKIGIIRLRFDEAKEALGERLLPAAESLVDWFTVNVMPTLEDAGELFKGMSDAVEDASGPMKGLGDKILPGISDGLFLMAMYMPEIAAAATKMGSLTVRAFMGLTVVALNTVDAVMTLGAAIQVGDARAEAFAERDHFRQWKDNTIADMDAVADGLMDAGNALDDYGDKARNVKRAELRADINDLTSQLLRAKVELNDPELSKERKAKVAANIKDLEDGLAAAKSKLNALDGDTVTMRVKVVVSRSGNVYQITPGQAGGAKPLFMAEGGIVTRATLAVVGEAGPEAVIPLDRAGGMGGVTVNVYGGLDSSEAIARRVQASLLDLKRRQGVNLGLA